MRRQAFLWLQILYAYCYFPDVLSNIVKGKKNAASHSLFVLNEFITVSWLKLPFLFFFTTHPFSNMFWILTGIYEKFICLSLRKAKIETLFDVSTWRFSAPPMVLPPGSFYLRVFQRPTFWEVGSGAICFFLPGELNQGQLFIHLFSVVNIYWELPKRFCPEVGLEYYHLGIYQDRTVILKV